MLEILLSVTVFTAILTVLAVFGAAYAGTTLALRRHLPADGDGSGR